MKNIILMIFTSILVATAGFGQKADYSCLFFGMGFGKDDYNEFYISPTYVNKSNISYGIVMFIQEKNAPNIPADYKPGTVFFSDGIPKKSIYNFGFTIGKRLNMTKKYLKAELVGGILFEELITPENFKPTFPTFGPGFEASNYSYDKNKKNTISLLINPKFQFIMWRAVGIELSFSANINKYEPTLGANLGFILGLIR
jgi:hypothetical protein